CQATRGEFGAWTLLTEYNFCERFPKIDPCVERKAMSELVSLPEDGVRRPFHDLLGLRVIEMKDGSATVVFDKTDELHNAFGGIHGGAIATLIDVASAMSIRSAQPDIRGSATISLSISFVDASSGKLKAVGTVT